MNIKYNKLNEKYNNLNEENNNNQKENKKLKNEINELKKQNKKNDLEIKNKEEQIKQLNKTIIETNEKIKETKQKNNELLEKIRDLNENLRKKEKEIGKLNKYIDENEKLLSQYEDDIKEEKKINVTLNEKITFLENEKTQIDNISKILDDDINQKNKRTIARLSRKIEDYEKNIIEKENKINELEEEIKKLNKEQNNLNHSNSLSKYSKIKTVPRLSQREREKLKEKEINKINNNNEIEITPEDYDIIKVYKYGKKLKWYLFKLKEENDENYDNFIWKPIKNRRDYNLFTDIPKNDSFELQKQINNLELENKDLTDKLQKKEGDYNRLSVNFAKLFNRKKNDERDPDKLIETIDQLKKENKNLNNQINKFKEEENVIGISFIEDDLESPQFIDELNFDELIDNLSDNGIFTYIGDKKEYNFKKKLKTSIDGLMAQININQNIKLTLASILKLLNLSDDEIYELIGKYRFEEKRK